MLPDEELLASSDEDKKSSNLSSFYTPPPKEHSFKELVKENQYNYFDILLQDDDTQKELLKFAKEAKNFKKTSQYNSILQKKTAGLGYETIGPKKS